MIKEYSLFTPGVPVPLELFIISPGNPQKNRKEGGVKNSKCVGVSGEKENNNFRRQNLP
jgi:hypothetical protein